MDSLIHTLRLGLPFFLGGVFFFFLFLFFLYVSPLLGKKSQMTKNQNSPRILDPLAAGNAHFVPIGPAIRPDLRPTLPRLSLSLFSFF